MSIEETRLRAAELSGGTSSPDIYAAALSAASSARPDARTVLDYGSGVGQLLPLARSLWPATQLSAADLMERPSGLPADVTWYTGDLNETLPAPSGAFDLIFAVEVIEHLENPRHVLREVHRLLAPGGAAVLTTPNPSSLRSVLTFATRGHFALFNDSNYPAHITPVGPADFRRASQEAGFSRCEFLYTNAGTIPKLLHTRWQSLPLIGGRLTGRLFSDNYGVVLSRA